MAEMALLRRRVRRAPSEPIDPFRAAAVAKVIADLNTAVNRLNATVAPILKASREDEEPGGRYR